MLRLITLLGLVALLGACDNSDKTSAPAGGETTAAKAAEPTAAKAGEHKHAAGEECQCSQGKAGKDAWCDQCGVGYVSGKKLTDKAEYDKAVAAK